MILRVVGCIARQCTALLACRKFVNFYFDAGEFQIMVQLLDVAFVGEDLATDALGAGTLKLVAFDAALQAYTGCRSWLLIVHEEVVDDGEDRGTVT
jgi:hypothetical protein